jgi:predicted GNAT family acetyltransferase
MVEMKFVDVGELWAPWCVALDGDEIASIAFTVGTGPASAEVGVATMPAFRGRGFAAAATAGWAAHEALRGRRLFYSTSWSNVSSQRVTERLGLRFIGTRFTIT